MRYLTNDRNLLRDAILSVSSLVASRTVYRTDSDPKSGGGSVSLSGDYTGSSDATFEVEVLDTAGSAPVVSEPVPSGVGNGVMSAVSADPGVAAQQIVVTLEDLGTQTRAAYAPFQSVTLRAQSSGAGGNDIVLTVSGAALVNTLSDYATQGEITAGGNEYVGEEWNFGAATLNPDGTIPSTAPRIRFGQDPQVYRAYRSYRAGRYVYGFSPAPVRNVARGTRVYTVTGTYVVTITNGGTPETHTGITTLYDCLSAIRADSDLVEVDGVVVNDRLPGGQGVTDLSVWTDPYIVSVTGDGTDFVRDARIDLTASANAPTELLTITCNSVEQPGAERWGVRGEVSGQLADAITGVLYADGPYGFTIPSVGVAEGRGTITVEYRRPDWDGETLQPLFCLRRPMLGAAARNGRYVFTYKKRPATDCNCADAELAGGPSVECLGLEPEEDSVVSQTSRRRRLQRLSDWVDSFVRSNTGTPGGSLSSVDQDIEFALRAASILGESINNIVNAGTLVPEARADSTAYAVDDVVVPATSNGFRYAATVAGTSGGSPPTFPTTVGDTVTDGGVTWENIGKLPLGMWDDLFDLVQADARVLGGMAFPEAVRNWYPITSYATGEYMRFQGRLFIAVEGGTSAGTTASTNQSTLITAFGAATVGSYVVDGGNYTVVGAGSEITLPEPKGVRWQCVALLPAEHAVSTAYSLGDRVLVAPEGAEAQFIASPLAIMECTTAGTSDSTAPTWPDEVGETVADGTVVWTRVGSDSSDVSPIDDAYYARYESAARAAAAAAGIDPDFDYASGQGDGCWRDFEPSYWFVPQDAESEQTRCPIQVGHYYHSARFSSNPNGERGAYSTQEFAFGPAFACPERLAEGDELVVTVADVGGATSYQQGDRITAQVLRGYPLQFGGGQTGDDTLTWSVIGSVDGGFDDYALVTTAPAAYSNGGLGFLITPGGIDFALGDRYVFSVEAARFQWRKNAGSWNGPTDIAASVALSDGLSAVFTPGTAPSWVEDDRWTFAAEAINGPAHCTQPTPGAYRWSGATVLTATPASADPISGLLIAEHTIPAGTSIRIEGSDDNFATAPLDETFLATAGPMWRDLSGDYAKYRISIADTGSSGWIWLGDALQLQIAGGRAEVGRLVQRRRLPSAIRRAGLGARVEHSAVTRATLDALLDGLAHACEFDEARLGIVLTDGEAAVVAYEEQDLEVTELFAFQPSDPTSRHHNVRFDLVAIP